MSTSRESDWDWRAFAHFLLNKIAAASDLPEQVKLHLFEEFESSQRGAGTPALGPSAGIPTSGPATTGDTE